VGYIVCVASPIILQTSALTGCVGGVPSACTSAMSTDILSIGFQWRPAGQ
jgi:hypothetical protein